MAPQVVQENQETWVSQELNKLRRGTLVLVIIIFSFLGILVGYFFLSDFASGPFTKVSYTDSGRNLYIEWETRFPAKTQVEYGTSEIYVNETSLSEGYETLHKAYVGGLLPDKAHYFRLVAEDEFGQRFFSPFYSSE